MSAGCIRPLAASTSRILKAAVASAHPLACQQRLMKSIPKFERFEGIVYPPDGQRLLPPLPMEPPLYPDEQQRGHRRDTRRYLEFRMPEQVHTELVHKQYAVVAERGGWLTPKHFELVRKRVNRRLAGDQFAVWRVERPWLPRTMKPMGMKRGGGKGKIRYFCTPVRAGGVIVELGGKITEDMARAILAPISFSLPMESRFVSHEELLEEAELKRWLDEHNTNPYSMELMCRFNMQNMSGWLSPYDQEFRGRFW